MLIFIVKKKGKTGNYGRGKGRGNIHFKRGEKGETGNSVREIDLSRVEALTESVAYCPTLWSERPPAGEWRESLER